MSVYIVMGELFRKLTILPASHYVSLLKITEIDYPCVTQAQRSAYKTAHTIFCPFFLLDECMTLKGEPEGVHVECGPVACT